MISLGEWVLFGPFKNIHKALWYLGHNVFEHPASTRREQLASNWRHFGGSIAFGSSLLAEWGALLERLKQEQQQQKHASHWVAICRANN